MITNVLGRQIATDANPVTLDEAKSIYSIIASFDSEQLLVKPGDIIETHSILPINVGSYPKVPHWSPGQLFKVFVVKNSKTLESIGVRPIINGEAVPNHEGSGECLWFRLGVLLVCSKHYDKGIKSFKYPSRLSNVLKE